MFLCESLCPPWSTPSLRSRYTDSFPGLSIRYLALSAEIVCPDHRKDHPMASPAVDFARTNQQRFLSELKDLLRIPSVSTLEEHKPDIQKAADYVANELRRVGMQ